MTEQIETLSTPPLSDAAPREADSVPLQARVATLADDRPEVAVAAAFAGGLVVALILKRLGR